MPKRRYTPIASVQLCEGRDTEAIRLLNEHASLLEKTCSEPRSFTVQATLSELLLEVLPARIADLRRQINAN